VFLVVVAIVMISILISIGNGLKEWSENNDESMTSNEVEVVKIKLMNRSGHVTVNPKYIITFRFSNGDNKKFYASKSEYNWLRVGDVGILISQGTRFISFEKKSVVE